MCRTALTHHPRAEKTGRVEDEGHAQRGLVGEDPVGGLAVLAQAFAVVAGQDHEGAAVAALREERLEQGLEQRVREGDLAVVEVRGEARGERLGRHVGEVGLVEVNPQEGLGTALRGQPAHAPPPRSRAPSAPASGTRCGSRGRPGGRRRRRTPGRGRSASRGGTRSRRRPCDSRPSAEGWPGFRCRREGGSPRCRGCRGRAGSGPRGCSRARATSPRSGHGPARSARLPPPAGPSRASPPSGCRSCRGHRHAACRR